MGKMCIHLPQAVRIQKPSTQSKKQRIVCAPLRPYFGECIDWSTSSTPLCTPLQCTQMTSTSSQYQRSTPSPRTEHRLSTNSTP